ncbi:tigger transposable element-derived protein 1-like [Palaemon carinicauda]|uniref:tigger transposable element-derived protein 1-like n=1 Tax=Palaemon carinicauda TaxID=392227 RepID=UPI0035B5BEF9
MSPKKASRSIGSEEKQRMIMIEASAIYEDLKQREAAESEEASIPVETFKATYGWFDNFEKRTGIHPVVSHRKAVNSNVKTAEEYVERFASLASREGYIPQQVINCNETGLFWNKMPQRTFIMAEEKKLSGHKPMKDRLAQENLKSWVMRHFFIERLNLAFGLAAMTYLMEKNLPFKGLLISDNASGHPPSLKDDILEDLKFIKVLYLPPPNTTPLLQPMD